MDPSLFHRVKVVAGFSLLRVLVARAAVLDERGLPVFPKFSDLYSVRVAVLCVSFGTLTVILKKSIPSFRLSF